MLPDLNEIGGKAGNLLLLRDKYELYVPEFEILRFRDIVNGFNEIGEQLEITIKSFLNDESTLDQCEKTLDHAIAGLSLNRSILEQALGKLLAKQVSKVSVRTSATLEDGSKDSFAGQYQSFLDLDLNLENLEIYCTKSFKSLLSNNVLAYAKSKAIEQYPVTGSVIIQEMFYGEASGVLFSENGSNQIQIAMTNSWQNQVVEGGDAREILVDKQELQKSDLPDILKTLCKHSLTLESLEGYPGDIEWAFNANQLAFLQYRPITLPNLNYSFEWDSTNIAENYPGITLPLTYSVIRQFYGAVYLAFFKMLGAKQKDLDAAAPITENMLGYLDGRVYYRITNWYKAIKLMPGKRNQEYFEAMLNPVRKRGKAEKTRMDFKSVITLIRLAFLLMNSDRISREFSKKISAKISFYEKVNFDYLNAATLLESGKRLRKEFLEDWAVTILNDVRLMIFHGILQRLYAKSENPKDYLHFMAGLTDKASIRPLEQLSRLGQAVQSALSREGLSAIEDLEDTRSWSQLRLQAQEYVNEFGARTPGELKLENERLADQIFTVLDLARKAAHSGIDASPSSEKRIFSWPSDRSPLLRPFIRYIAKNTRQAIDWRERFRFNRAQTFNLSRRGFDAVGNALAAEGVIENPRDVYWLTDQEVEDLVGAHAPVLDAKLIISHRKEKFAEYEKLDKTLAVTGFGRIAGLHQVNVLANDSVDGLLGNGVAPGEVSAEVLVLKEFDSKADVRGKILVVHHIDPGWTLLFTQAAGIIAERGNALSHAAIIAREIGIPAIVAAVSATSALQTGEIITMNGTSGVITR